MNKYLELTKYVIRENQKLKKKLKSLEELFQQKGNSKECLTVKEVCENYGLSRKTFDRYRSQGLITSQPIKNGRRFTKKNDIENFIKNKRNGR